MSELRGKKIAITGGTGTIGQACLQEILESYADVAQVIIYSRDELKQLEMMEKYPEGGIVPVSYHLGDIRDEEHMREVFKEVDYVIHAAAIKHVVMAEKNPEECRKTNVEGTKNVISVAVQNKVEKTLLVSTDKAQNPIGVYGKSKLAAEQMFLDAQPSDQFSIVRLGNVIDSRGSVFEAFRKQRKTGILKVTHPDATRFCISKEATAAFIMSRLTMDHTDRISVPEMESVRIVDLAKEIAPECEITFTGLRPGDKLHEELGALTSEDQILSYKFDKYGA